jgi:thiamine-monophosphate kinase
MRESDLLRHIYKTAADLDAQFPQVVVGPGHDCAVIAAPGGECLLLKVDQVVGGRHFRAFPHTPLDLIARKAIARAISDIAAAGGAPLACMVGAVLPHDFEHAADLVDALDKWARHFRCPSVGGDVSTWGPHQKGELVLGISIIGTPHRARGPVLRSGAAPGDWVYVTGELGGSIDPATGHGRHLLFEPRLAEARWLCDTLGERLHSMMDISDGLGRDAGRMAAASGVQFRIDAASIPRRGHVPDWRAAVGDGEDYELLFTAPADAAIGESVPQLGTRITRIGTVERGAGCIIETPEGSFDGAELGWEHGRE